MATTQRPDEVTVSVEFAGVCLYVIDDRQQKRSVSVLVPTCVPIERVRTHHDDEDVGARHVPYLLMDLANLDLGQTVAPGLVPDGPRFQVVRRLSREELFFAPGEPQGSVVQLVPDPLPLPDLSVYKDRIRLKDLLSAIPPNERPELNVRTILKGGTLAAITVGGSGNGGGRPSQNPGRKNPKWDEALADWAGSIKWTRTIKKEVLQNTPFAIQIRSWDTGKETPLTLKPVERTNGGVIEEVIELKIANLCETNPLEWKEFEHRSQEDDVDFKWLFRLFEASNGGSLLEVFGGRGHKFPYPKLKNRPARTTGSTGCTGGQFGIP